jgi:signal transduction histidine kinase
MAQEHQAARPFPIAIAALTAIWLVIAIVGSAFALHLCLATVRNGDVELTEASSGLARMADAMSERGSSASDVVTAVSAAAKSRGLDVAVHAMPTDRPPEGFGGPPRRPDEPFAFMPPPPTGMFGLPDPTQSPAMMMHIGSSMVILTLDGDPVDRIMSWYFLWMVLLVVVAVASTTYANQRMMRRALAPAQTIESALRRLAGGEYTRLEVVGHEPAEAQIVDAYNAAADELASSIRLRAEAESNLRLFVADAGHELRTPLTVIMGFVDVLRQGAIAEQAVAQRILDSVAAEGERMRVLISKLLLLARLDTVAPERHERVDLSRIAAEMVDSFRPIAGDATLGSGGEPEVTVIGSLAEMREIVGILVDNALKYAPGSRVDIAVERQERMAALTVNDDGPGMPPDLQARAFDRFSRGDDRGSIPGSGLGLAIVKRIATRAGGDVELASAPGKGTRVTVRLPLAPA